MVYTQGAEAIEVALIRRGRIVALTQLDGLGAGVPAGHIARMAAPLTIAADAPTGRYALQAVAHGQTVRLGWVQIAP